MLVISVHPLVCEESKASWKPFQSNFSVHISTLITIFSTGVRISPLAAFLATSTILSFGRLSMCTNSSQQIVVSAYHISSFWSRKKSQFCPPANPVLLFWSPWWQTFGQLYFRHHLFPTWDASLGSLPLDISLHSVCRRIFLVPRFFHLQSYHRHVKRFLDWQDIAITDQLLLSVKLATSHFPVSFQILRSTDHIRLLVPITQIWIAHLPACFERNVQSVVNATAKKTHFLWPHLQNQLKKRTHHPKAVAYPQAKHKRPWSGITFKHNLKCFRVHSQKLKNIFALCTSNSSLPDSKWTCSSLSQKRSSCIEKRPIFFHWSAAFVSIRANKLQDCSRLPGSPHHKWSPAPRVLSSWSCWFLISWQVQFQTGKIDRIQHIISYHLGRDLLHAHDRSFPSLSLTTSAQ